MEQGLRRYDVRVELDDWVSDEELRADLSTGLGADPAGWFGDLEPRVATTEGGRPAVELRVPAQDVWSSALTAMAVLRQRGYEPLALHVESREERPAD